MGILIRKVKDSPRFTRFIKQGKLLQVGDTYEARNEQEAEGMCVIGGFERVTAESEPASELTPEPEAAPKPEVN